MTKRVQRLGVLLSGRGSNFAAIADAIATGTLAGCEIAVVLSNREQAEGLQTARDRGLPVRVVPSKGKLREEHDAAMISALREAAADYVILTGYMRVVTPTFIQAYPDRILNIHPSLLPAFPGLHAQAQALEYGAKVAGCTVHFVDEAVDHGTIILQGTVPVLDGDDEATLSARILVEEHAAYPQAIARVLSGDYSANGRRYEKRTRGAADAKLLE